MPCQRRKGGATFDQRNGLQQYRGDNRSNCKCISGRLGYRFTAVDFCMVADYITGVLGAIKQRNLNSEVMFWGESARV